MSRTIIFIWGNDSIIGTDPEHMFGRLRRTSVDGEGIFVMIDSAEVGELGFKRCFDFPVLDQILH